MKVLIIKQKYDMFGPWRSFKYSETSPLEILKSFHSKINGYEVFLLFEADSILVDTYYPDKDTAIKYHVMEVRSGLTPLEFKKQFDEQINPVKVENIPFGDYDIVWCRNPFLDIRALRTKYPKVVFIYELLEDWIVFPKKHLVGYDYFVDHMDFTFQKKGNKLGLPYPRCPDKLRELFPVNKEKYVYIDWRMWESYDYFENTLKPHGFTTIRSVNQDKTMQKIKLAFSLQPDNEGAEYFTRLAKSKYFVANIRRVGQSVVDAASLGCICIGSRKSPGHRSICHPYCFVGNNSEIAQKIVTIENDPDLQSAILQCQERQLRKYYVEIPKNMLAAIVRK